MKQRYRFAAATTCGAITAFSLPPWGLWPIAIIGLGIFLKLLDSPSWKSRLATAWFFWVGFYVIGLVWMIDLTLPGWILATPIEALIMGLPFLLLPNFGILKRVGFPAALIVGESIRWVIPFGGVPMSNLALGQIDAPWVSVVKISGPLLLIGMLGLAASTFEAILVRRFVSASMFLITILATMTIASLAPTSTVDSLVQAGVVQAGGDLGTRAVSSDQANVFDRHVNALEKNRTPMDLVVWSESSAISNGPLENSVHLNQLAKIATARDTTIIANFSERDGNYFKNVSVVVAPEAGLLDRYEKTHLVPFGEYIPFRKILDRFTDLSMVPRDALPGQNPGVMDSPFGPIGNAISFEIYFPEQTRRGINNGARIITNPTLASSYTNSAVPSQSLASARLRAIETSRWVLQASTTGFSAIIDPDGKVIEKTELKNQQVLSSLVELRSGKTWAVSLGKAKITWFSILLLVLIGCFFRLQSLKSPVRH